MLSRKLKVEMLLQKNTPYINILQILYGVVANIHMLMFGKRSQRNTLAFRQAPPMSWTINGDLCNLQMHLRQLDLRYHKYSIVSILVDKTITALNRPYSRDLELQQINC